MALESGNYISNLVVTNPLGSDPKNQGDDHLRIIKRAITQGLTGFAGNVMTTGTDVAGATDNDFVVTATTAPLAYTDRMIVTFTATHTNSAAATIDINGLGVKPLVDVYGGPLVPGAIPSAAEVMAVYDGTRFKLLTGVFTLDYALPSMPGNAGKVLTTDGAIAEWGYASIPASARTSNVKLVESNTGYLVDITSGTFSQTFDSAATLGSGWWLYLSNSGTGDITLTPDGSEQIDGRSSYIMYPGEIRLIRSDGLNLYSMVLKSFNREFTASGTFTVPTGYNHIEGLLWGGGGSGGKYTDANGGSGGGGGACHKFLLEPSDIYPSVNFTLGAGGSAITASGTSGNDGGNSTFATFTAFGGAKGGNGLGGGGGGVMSKGNGGASGNPDGGTSSNRQSTYGGGGGGNTSTTTPGLSYYGGGGGSATTPTTASDGGKSFFGGGGGGSSASVTPGNGGSSTFGGNGGNGGYTGSATDGATPGGGGGGTGTGTASGAGGNGLLKIWGVI